MRKSTKTFFAENTNNGKLSYPAWKGKVKQVLNGEGRLLAASLSYLLPLYMEGLSPTAAAARCVEDGLVA